MIKKALLITFVLCLSLLLQAGISSGYYNNPEFRLNSILNPNNFSMTHSLSFSSGFSSSGTGYYSNIYTNHLDFKLNKNLNLKLNLNFVNDGSFMFNNNYDMNWNNDNQTRILPEFRLEWQPSENTTLTIQFEQRNRYDYWHINHNNDPFNIND